MVVDLGFLRRMDFKHGNSMTQREIPYGLSYLKRCSGRLASVVFTSFDPECSHCRGLLEFFHTEDTSDASAFPFFITEKSYLDMFPRDRLLYLSPDSRNDMVHYNDDDVVIIGGLVGKDGEKATLSKAKQQEIRHARFPMKRTLGFTKDLNVDVVLPILNDFRQTNDWLFSFRWVPSRIIGQVAETRGTPNDIGIYKAHRALCPTGIQTENKFDGMNNIEYRRRYKEIVRNGLIHSKFI
jgi:hypothetical protein